MRRLILIAGMMLVAEQSPAVADVAHDTACAAALTEAQSLQSDLGIWRAEARVLAAHRNDKKFTEMAQDHRRKELVLSKRLSDADSGQFALHKEGACLQDADMRAALGEATRFMNMPDQPSQAPLPEGYCRNSPDLSAPLVPCRARPAQ